MPTRGLGTGNKLSGYEETCHGTPTLEKGLYRDACLQLFNKRKWLNSHVVFFALAIYDYVSDVKLN